MHMRVLRQLNRILIAAVLAPSFLTVAHAQKGTRASLAFFLPEAVQNASDLKDERSRADLFVAVGTARARAGSQSGARTAFHQALQNADAIEDPSDRVYGLENIAVAQIESNDLPSALATMRHALEVADSIGDKHQRNTTRMWIVRTFARSGDVDAALRIVADLPEQGGYKARALANIMDGLNQSGKEAMKKFWPTLIHTAGGIHGQIDQAECLQGVAEVLADSGDVERTLEIAEAFEKAIAEIAPQNPMLQSMLHRQVFVLSALAKAQARAGNREEAEKNFKRAVDLAAVMAAEGESLRSDRLGRVVRSRVEAGDIEGAVGTTELIVYEYPKAVALITIAEAQAKDGRREQARLLFGKAIYTANEIHIRDPRRDRPQSPDLNLPECLRTLAFVQARAGFASEAVHTALTINSPQWRNSALAQIAPLLAKGGDMKQAVELLGKIDDRQSKDSAMQDIAEWQAETGDFQAALEWARSRANPEARANAFLGLARAVARRPWGN